MENEHDKINLHLLEGQTELVVRHGDALPVSHPKNVSIIGTITAVAEWVKKRKDAIMAVSDKCHIIINKKSACIYLNMLEDREHGTVYIEGKMLDSDQIKRWEDKEYDIPAMARMLRKYQSDFGQADQAKLLLEQISAFSANIGRKLEDHDDKKGNIRKVFDQTLKTNVMQTIEVKIPFFTGSPDQFCEAEVLVHLQNERTPVVEIAIVDLEKRRNDLVDHLINLEMEQITEALEDKIPVIFQ